MTFIIVILVFLITWLIIGLYHKNTNAISKSKKRLDGKVAIVTGGTSGIGFEVARDFAHRGAKVIIACPFKDEGQNAREQLIKNTGNENVVFKHLDLASLHSVKLFATEILKSEERLDLLINNAGIGTIGDTMTKDGMHQIMQVNYFGPFLLTLLLLPLLKQTGTPKEPARIVNTSSCTQTFGKIEFAHWNKTNWYWSQLQVYANSKLCLVLFARELSKYLSNTDVVVHSVDPGAVGTNIFTLSSNKYIGNLIRYINNYFFKTPWDGAQTTIYAALNKRPGQTNGEFYKNCRVSKANSLAYNDDLCKSVWQETCKLVKYTEHVL